MTFDGGMTKTRSNITQSEYQIQYNNQYLLPNKKMEKND